MMKLLRILKAIFKQSIIYETQYRVNFFINMITNFGWAVLIYLSVIIIGTHVTTISQNWTRAEYTVFYGIFSISTFGVNALFKRNIQDLPNNILRGELDFTLIKPFNSKLLTSLGYTRFGLIPTILLILVYSLNSLAQIENGLPFLANAILFISIIPFTILIEYALYFTFVSLSFWLIGAYNLPYVFSNLTIFGNYPIKAFGLIFQFMLTVVFPIAFVGYFPSRMIIDASPIILVAIIFVTIITYKFSSLVWNLGLKRYESASS